jgi:hypothetical protein
VDLLEALARTAPDQLARIARSAGFDPETDRQTLEQQLAACLMDRAWLAGLLADLADEEWAALKVVFYNGGDRGITVELTQEMVAMLAGKRRQASGWILAALQDRGLIFPRTLQYRQVFFIPTDLLQVLGEILNRQVIYRVCLQGHENLRASVLERDLVEDVHRFLAYIYRHDVNLTQQWQIFKRHLRALLELLGSGDDEAALMGGRYPEPLGLLVGYGLDRRLIDRREGHLRATEALTGWVASPTGAKRLDLFRYWQDRYFYQDLQTFLSVMQAVGTQWVSVDRMARELEPLINPSRRGSFLLRLKHHLSTFLGPLGICELGQAGSLEAPELICRLTPAGLDILAGRTPDEPAAARPALVLQPNFEVIAPRPVPAEVLWHLELMGDLVHRTDRTLTYRLSRQSIYRGLKAGLSGPQMEGFLRAHSATGIPQNVAFDLQTWAAAYGQVYLQRVTLLRCANPILAEQIKASRRTGRFIAGALTPTDLIVREDHDQALLEALEAEGLMPRPGIRGPEDEQEAGQP